jgi:hypothetical protein
MASLLAVSAGAQDGASAQSPSPELAYEQTEGENINVFLRDGASAAHVLLRSGEKPRILVAFPAGNSGVGLWFERLGIPAHWTLEQQPRPYEVADRQGRVLNGIRMVARVTAPTLTVRQAVLSNVRFLRDYQAVGRFPDAVAVTSQSDGETLTFSRDRADGAPGYSLSLEVLSGRLDGQTLRAGSDGMIRLMITAATGDLALTGFSAGELLKANAADDPVARNALRFLSYREKFLAGSWRFNTYFGRDTLMSVQLLMPVLKPPAVQAGLNSVLARLDAQGAVAHEEALSEFALLERRRSGEVSDAPTLDYAMIDDDFMLAPVAATYLLDHADRAQAQAWLGSSVALESRLGETEAARALLLRNLRFVVEASRLFAEDPQWQNLIGLLPGKLNGQWRDSHEGLGGGRYAYDVNAVLVPAALNAAARIAASGVLGELSAQEAAMLALAEPMAHTWRTRAPGMFRVSTPARKARRAVTAYANALGIPAEPALAALGRQNLDYNAIALDAQGKPVPIIHSDEGFALLFTDPAPANLDLMVTSTMRPFPAGLMTDIGMVVANAALASDPLKADFAPAKYHGAVVWSWQQALFAAGLERQLKRTDLPLATRLRLTKAQADLWHVIKVGREVQSSELWSWAFVEGRYKVVAFGAGQDDVDESNAAQLWSTVYLAVQPPK